MRQTSQKPLRDPRRQRARLPGSSKRYHHGDLPRALLSAALTIVESRGSEALTVRAAARLARVSQTAPYRHFANKEAILAAVAEEGFRSLIAAMAHEAALADSPVQRLRAVGLAYVTFATDHSAHFRVMFGREMADRSASSSLRQISTDTFNVVVDVISDCQRAGLVRSEEPAADLALTAWSTVHGLSTLLVNGVLDRSIPEVAEIVTRDLFLGLGVRHG
jgi:AcrR family transcriptional regulator